MGGYSKQCSLCQKWFLNPGSHWDHMKWHRDQIRPQYSCRDEEIAFDRGFRHGFDGYPQQKTNWPNAYGRGYNEGLHAK